MCVLYITQKIKYDTNNMYKQIIIILLLLSLSSCASWIPKPHEMPSPDIIFIHKNPSVGDYAVYQSKGSVAHRYEVYKINGNHITVRYRVTNLDPDYKEFSRKEWYYRQINRGGQVIKAWAQTDAGEYFNTAVARSGSVGSLEHLTKINGIHKKPVKTRAGTFKVDGINTYIYRLDAGLVSTNSSCMEYYSNEVPFRSLKREMVHSADVGAFLKTTEYIKVIGDIYLTEDYLKLYNKATEGDMKYQSTMELIEYGFAK